MSDAASYPNETSAPVAKSFWRRRSGLWTSWSKTSAILAEDDRRRTVYAFFVAIAAALSSALMVASVLPFLTVLSDPGSVQEIPAIARMASFFGLSEPYSILVAVGIGSLILIALASATQIWKLIVLERYSGYLAYRISCRLFAIYLGKPYTFFIERHGSDMATIILSEVGEAIAFFIRPAMQLAAASLTLIAIAALMFWVDPLLAAAVLVVTSSIFGVTYIITKRYVRRQGQIRVKANNQRYRVTHEAFNGIKEIKLLGLEERYGTLYETPAMRTIEAVIAVRFASQVPRNVIYAIASGGVILLCLLLVPEEAYLSGDGLSDIVPLLGMFALGLQRLIPELQKIYAASNEMQYGLAAIDRLYADFVGVEHVGALPPGPKIRLRSQLELRNVEFTYPNATRAGLQDISFTIQAGEKIGVVGATGAGKTTLADVVLGLLAPQKGEILADGHLLTGPNVSGWQKSVAYVPQDIFLSDSSIGENIAFGVAPEDVDQDRLRRVARIANILDLIEQELPNGFDTELGERGIRLSGGQRQRVGIARALYRDADLIVFDEATSALDTLTEREIMSALNALPETKTLLLIAHRLSTVRACDRIFVFENGRLTAVGPWEELVATNPAFQELVASNAIAGSGGSE